MIIHTILKRAITYYLIVCTLLVFTTVVTLPIKVSAQEAIAIGIHIPVIINIYPGSGTTEAAARAAIAEANKILKQASIKLHVVQVNNPPGSGNGDNGDGDFTLSEREKIREFGGKELKKLQNRKGIKISFGKTPKVGELTPGVSVHRDPTIIVKDRGTAQLTGETIAHELGHVMTLARKHKINGEESDDDGHAKAIPNNKFGRGNFMAPSIYEDGTSFRNGTYISDSQKKEMQKTKYEYGKCSSQFSRTYPAQKDKQGFGAERDDLGDHTSSSTPHDIGEVVLTTLQDSETIDGRIGISAVLPTNEEIQLTYSAGMDTDASAVTGITFAGQSGVDKIVRIILSGNIGLSTFIGTGEVEDTISSTITPLPQTPQVETEPEFADQSGVAVDNATSILFSVPKPLLDITATVVPIVIAAGDGVSIFDITSNFFNINQWLDDPTLNTFGNGVPTPGLSYPVEIQALKPNSPFNLYLDDLLVLSDFVDSSGNFSGEFVFPAYLSNTDFYFLTAQDETGEFAYSISCPLPPITAIRLTSFNVIQQDGQNYISWATGTEIGTEGFHILRSTSPDGSYSRITASLIESNGDAFTVGRYNFVDIAIEDDKSYYYKLEEVDAKGNSAKYGPIIAVRENIIDETTNTLVDLISLNQNPKERITKDIPVFQEEKKGDKKILQPTVYTIVANADASTKFLSGEAIDEETLRGIISNTKRTIGKIEEKLEIREKESETNLSSVDSLSQGTDNAQLTVVEKYLSSIPSIIFRVIDSEGHELAVASINVKSKGLALDENSKAKSKDFGLQKRMDGEKIILTWYVTEPVKGLYILRSTKKDGPYHRLTKTPIPYIDLGIEEQLFHYTYIDNRIEKGETYYYKLEAIPLASNLVAKH